MGSFGQVVTAMVTPFTQEGTVNFEEAIRIAHHCIDNGSDTLLLAGTTGESPTLTHEEENKLFKVMVNETKGKSLIMAGTGSNCTQTAINATQEAEALGVDASLQVVPYYNKPSQEGIIQHFKAIAESTSLPIMLYNIPGRTGINMQPETIATLSGIPNIVAIKEAAGSIEQVKHIKSLVPEDFDIYSGDDGLTLPFMQEGAVGVVSVASHCAGSLIQSCIQAYLNGDIKKAEDIHDKLTPLYDVLFITSNPVPVKAALSLMGFKPGRPRLPLVEATQSQIEKVKDVLVSLSLIS